MSYRLYMFNGSPVIGVFNNETQLVDHHTWRDGRYQFIAGCACDGDYWFKPELDKVLAFAIINTWKDKNARSSSV